MANINSPSGFKVANHKGGGTANRMGRYHIAGGYGTNICAGDAVIPTATSKNVARPGSATDRLIGVFDGCFYLDPNQSAPQYNRLWPASQVILSGSAVDCQVYDDPNDVFEAQMSNAFAATGIGSLADLVIGTANVNVKTSADAIDSTTVDASGTVFRIEDIVNRPDNAVGQYAKVLVSISKHYRAGAQTGI